VTFHVVSFDIETRKEEVSAAHCAHSQPKGNFDFGSDSASDRGMGGTARADRGAL